MEIVDSISRIQPISGLMDTWPNPKQPKITED